jgi:DNA-binding transcriptional LysR family regulator
LYAAPAYLARHGEPAAPDDLLALHSLVIPGRDAEPAPWILQRAAAATPEHWRGLPAPRALVNSPAALLQLAAAGLGIVASTEWHAAALLASGDLRRVLPDWCLPPVPGWAVFPGRRLMPAKTSAFVAELERALNA